jgi:hypothetical protein
VPCVRTHALCTGHDAQCHDTRHIVLCDGISGLHSCFLASWLLVMDRKQWPGCAGPRGLRCQAGLARQTHAALHRALQVLQGGLQVSESTELHCFVKIPGFNSFVVAAGCGQHWCSCCMETTRDLLTSACALLVPLQLFAGPAHCA